MLRRVSLYFRYQLPDRHVHAIAQGSEGFSGVQGRSTDQFQSSQEPLPVPRERALADGIAPLV